MKRFWISIGFALISGATLPAATITPATGGSAISSDSTGGSYTTLTGPIYQEGSLGDVSTGNVILKAPAGFMFDTNAVVTVLLNGGSNNSRNINDLPDGSTIAVSVTSTTLTFNVTANSKSGSGSALNKLTWQNVRVRPIAGTPLASGNITKSPGSTMASVTDNSTNFGTLTEVVGTVARMFVTLPNQTFTTGTGNSGAVVTQTVATVFNISKLTATDAHTNIVASYSGAKTISYSGPGGSPTYTTAVSFTGGQSTTTLATTLTVAETTAITATDGTLTGVPSSSLTVIKGNQSISFGALADKTYGDATFGVSATASSGLAVSFSILSGPATISGTNVTLTGNGTVTVRAAQPGDSNWNAAANVDQSFNVAKATVTGHITADNKTYDGTNTATIATRTLTGAVGLDVVNLTGGTASFADKNVGTSKTITATGLSLTGADAGKYNLASSTVITNADITARALTVSATGINKVYDGNTNATVTLSDNRVAGDILSVNYTSATFADTTVDTGKPVSVGGITVTGADASNYTFNTTASTTADITARPLTVTATGINKDYDSTADATVTLSDNRVSGDTLTLGYTSAAFTDKNVGTGKSVNVSGITVTGADAGNYTFNTTAATTANIASVALTGSITADNKVYDGAVTATIASRSLDGVIGSDDVSYTGGTAVFDDKNVANGKTVTATGLGLSGADAGNYTVNTTALTTADITERTLIISATGIDKVYDGTTNATVTLTDDRVDGDILTNEYATASFADKTVDTDKPVSVSGITVTGTDAGNYTFNSTASTTANITAASLTVTGVRANNKIYDGETTATLDLDSAALFGVIDGDVVMLETNSAAGAFADKNVANAKPVTVNGLAISGDDAGNYSLTQPGAIADITPATVTGVITAADKEYDALTTATIATRSLNGVIDEDDVSLTGGTADFEDKHVGPGKLVTATGLSLAGAEAGNYELASSNATTTAEITARALTVSATGVNRVYDATTNATVTLSDDRILGDDLTPAYTSAAFDDKEAGNGKPVSVSGISITGPDAGNYTFNTTATTTANITMATLTALITADDREYDATTNATIATRSLTGVIDEDDVTLTGGTASFDNKHVGTGKTVTATGLSLAGLDAGNYELASTSATTAAEITPRALTVSALGVNRAYDGTTNATVTLSDDRLSGDSFTTAYSAAAFDDKNIGDAKPVSVSGISLTGADAGDYTFNTTASTTADITAAILTGSVTASDKPYDGLTDATITSRDLSGVVDGEDVTLIGGTANFADQNVGSNKTVTATGLSLSGDDTGNYELASSTVITTASITRISLTVTADNKNRGYQQANPTFTASFSGFVSGDDTNVVSGVPDFSTPAVESSPVGNYPIIVTVGSLSAANYNFDFVNGTLTVGKALLTVTADDQSRSYGATNPVLTVTYDGFLDGDNESVLSGEPELSTTATTNSTVAGTPYVITVDVGTLSATNYDFAFVNGQLDVTPAVLTVTADDKSKVYGDAVPTLTASIAGFVNDEDESVITGEPELSTAATTNSTVAGSPYEIAVTNGTLSADNYAFAFVGGTLTVTPATVTGSITADNKIYDGTTNATIATRSLDGVIGDDDVSLIGGTATFADKNVANGKTVSATGLSLSGADAGNYELASTSAETMADITERDLIVSATGISKDYDGTADAEVTLADDRVAGDSLSTSYTSAAFDDSSAGNGKSVSVSGINVTGADAGNYTFNATALTTANIIKATVTGSISVANKVYDGTTAATITNRLLSGVIGLDDVSLTGGTATFMDKHVGNNKTVNATGLSLAGADAGNYQLASTSASTTANITELGLTVSATGVNKVYDGTTNATVTLSDDRVLGDTLTPLYASAAFEDKNVGDGKNVSVTGITLTGVDAGNYVFNTNAVTTANITGRSLTVSATGVNREYDGTTNATVTLSDDRVLGDVLSTSYTSAAFASKNVGTGKPVSVSGINVTGTDSGNYTFNTNAVTTANITGRSLTVSATGVNREYDGTTNATVTLSDDRVLGDVLNTSYTSAAFASKNVGTGKSVSVSGISVAGTDSVNYTFNTTASTTANIDARALTVSATGVNKQYDGTTAATVTLSDNRIGGDVLTNTYASALFSDKTVGTGKSISVTGINVTGTDAGNYTFNTTASATANITAKGLTVTGVTASNRVYDGTTNATINTGSAVLVGVIGGDSVTLNTAGVAGAFADKNIGTNKPVTVSGLALANTDAGNYTLTQPTTTANITAKGLTISGVTANDKIYDGNTTATLNTGTAALDGVISGDVVNLNTGGATGLFADKLVGTSKPVSISGFTISGAGVGNYTLSQPSATASITAKTLTVTGITASNKTYDGNATATINTNSAVLVGKVSGDTVNLSTASATGTFVNKNVGTGKTVNIAGLSVSGADIGNYSLTQPTTTANITTRTLTVTATGINKVYDATTTATVTLSDNRVAGDVLTNTYTSATFSSKDVGNGKTVSVTGIAVTGTDSSNYTHNTTASTTANITLATLTVTFTVSNKVYDGNTTASILTRTLNGVLGSDNVSVSGGTATFDNKNVGTAKTVTGTSFTLGGGDKNNYQFDPVSPTTTANITARSLTVSATGINRVYDGTTNATVTLTDNRVAGDVLTVNYTSASFATKTIGTGKTVSVSGITVTGTDAGNYTFNTTASTTANITSRTLTAIGITASSKPYDGNVSALINTAGATLTNVVSGDVVSLNLGGAFGLFINKNVGTNKTVTINGLALAGGDSGNYTLPAPTTTADITARALTISATGVNKAYDGNTTATVTLSDNRIGGDVMTTGYTAANFITKSVATGKTVNVTGITLTGTDAGNYSFNTNAATTANITSVSVTGHITANNKIYDGTNTATIATRTLTGVIGLDDVTLTGGVATFADKNVGTGKLVTATGLSLGGGDGGNYTLSSSTATTNANITAATLTVTADNKSRPFGETNPVLTVSYSGFASGDNAGVLSGAPSLNTTADTESSAGNYPITVTVGSLSALNYTFAFVDGSLTVTGSRPVLTVTADNKMRAYGETNPVFTVSYSGFVNEDDESVLSGAPELSSAATTNSPVAGNPYVIAVTNGTLSAVNYDFAFVNGQLLVTQAVLTVTADDQSKVYGDDVPTLTASYSGFVLDEDATVLSGEPELSTTATNNSSVAGSPYPIAVTNGTLAADNYAFVFVSGSLTVTPATVTANITAENKEYDATTNAIISGSLDGVIGDDDVSLNGTGSFDDKNVGTGKTVSATGLSLSGADVGNYMLDSDSASTTADITARTLTVGATGISRMYDGSMAASVTLSDDRILGDDLSVTYTAASFLDKNAGNGKTVNVTGIDVTGADAINYAFNSTASTVADISEVPLTGSFLVSSKIYDGTTAATITNRSLDGVIGLDDVSLTGGTANFVDKDVETGKTVTGTGFSLSGADAVDYTVIIGNTTADITAAGLTITADNKSKTEGLPNPTLTAQYSGFVSGEDESVLTTPVDLSTTADINSPVGEYTITASGAAAANYSISYNAGTLAVLPVPQLGNLVRSGNTLSFSFPTIVGQTYQIEYKDSLNAVSWTPLGDPMPGTGVLISLEVDLTGTSRFFRLRVTN